MILMTRFLKIGLSLVATQKDSPGRKIIQYKLTTNKSELFLI